MTKPTQSPDATEQVVTEAMLEAGAQVHWQWAGSWASKYTLAAIYRAMQAAALPSNATTNASLVERIKQMIADRKHFFDVEGDGVDVLLTDCWNALEAANLATLRPSNPDEEGKSVSERCPVCDGPTLANGVVCSFECASGKLVLSNPDAALPAPISGGGT